MARLESAENRKRGEVMNINDMAYIERRRRRIAEYYSSKYASIDFANHIALPKF